MQGVVDGAEMLGHRLWALDTARRLPLVICAVCEAWAGSGAPKLLRQRYSSFPVSGRDRGLRRVKQGVKQGLHPENSSGCAGYGEHVEGLVCI